MADRYCRNCGQEMAEDDRFCSNCGRPAHATAHIPTPEADVPVPSPPQQVPRQGWDTSSTGPQAGAPTEEGPRAGRRWGPLVGTTILTGLVLIALIGGALAGNGGGGGNANQGSGGNGEGANRESRESFDQTPAEDQGSGETFTRENYAELATDPDEYAGAKVDITGQLLEAPEIQGDQMAFQMWADPENLEWNTIVFADDTGVDLEADDYAHVRGTVEGSIEGENAFGATITAVEVEASKVEPVSAAEAVDPAIKTVEVGQTQADQGFSITLRKIEFGEDTTRLYISARNGTNAPASFFTYDAKIIQGGRQIEEDMSFSYELPEPQSDIEPGVKTDGAIILGKAEPAQPMTLKFEWYSENYNITAHPIVFEVTPQF